MTDRFEDVVRGEFAALPTPPPLDPARVVAHARTQGRGLRLALWVAIAVLAALRAGTVWVWSSVEHAVTVSGPSTALITSATEIAAAGRARP